MTIVMYLSGSQSALAHSIEQLKVIITVSMSLNREKSISLIDFLGDYRGMKEHGRADDKGCLWQIVPVPHPYKDQCRHLNIADLMNLSIFNSAL